MGTGARQRERSRHDKKTSLEFVLFLLLLFRLFLIVFGLSLFLINSFYSFVFDCFSIHSFFSFTLSLITNTTLSTPPIKSPSHSFIHYTSLTSLYFFMLSKFIDLRDRDSYSTFTSATGINLLTSFLTEETDDMRKGTRPPPLNLSIVTRPRSLPRLSTTPIARELTPLLTPLPEEVEEPAGAVVRAVRAAVDFMQIVSCLLVILMLAIFLVSYSGAAVSSHGYASHL
jgi:hypothetical protein